MTHSEWVYEAKRADLEKKVRFLIGVYNSEVKRHFGKTEPRNVANQLDAQIKWSRAVKQDLAKGIKYTFKDDEVISALYRPFVKRYLYFSQDLNEMQYRLPEMFPIGKQFGNTAIWMKLGTAWPFFSLAVDVVPDLLPAGGSICFSLYRYTANGERVDNITDWALEQFRARYGRGADGRPPLRKIGKEDIFHYVYAVLHHPAYREKYALNLKREFPRIPFYDDFWQWVKWGEQLMDLHLNYEKVKPYRLKREDKKQDPKGFGNPTGLKATPRLMARKETSIIEVDTLTTLRGVPPEAWDYRLGTYTALEWVLERYKERKPKDPTIREKFNTYRFADYKEQVIDLLRRVCTVSVETMKVIKQMPG